jgi:3-dehydroquinate dehydratase-2
MKILVLNGPNLNLLGTREPEIYGSETLADIAQSVTGWAAGRGVTVEFRQSNHEGDLVSWIGATRGEFDGIIINPAAYTHTSLALCDALKAVADVVPAVEIHLSNTHKREKIRHTSLTAAACVGQIMGFGSYGYQLALDALIQTLKK